VSKLGHTANRDLVAALRRQTVRVGSNTSSVRGAQWRMGVVATVSPDGTMVTTDDGITARRLDSYLAPAAGDIIALLSSGTGSWLAQGRAAAPGAGFIGQTLAAYKTSTTARASTITSTDDPHLTLSVVAGSTYAFNAYIGYNADVTADLKVGWTSPAASTGSWGAFGADVGATTIQGSPRWGATTSISGSTITVGAIGTGTNLGFCPAGTFTAGASGTFALSWSQAISSATATSILANSHLRLLRIA
jgi:hypothetical protein